LNLAYVRVQISDQVKYRGRSQNALMNNDDDILRKVKSLYCV